MDGDKTLKNSSRCVTSLYISDTVVPLYFKLPETRTPLY